MGNKRNTKKRKTTDDGDGTTGPARKKSKTPKITKSDSYYSETAALEIVSADHVLFKIEAYHLQSNSCVLLPPHTEVLGVS